MARQPKPLDAAAVAALADSQRRHAARALLSTDALLLAAINAWYAVRKAHESLDHAQRMVAETAREMDRGYVEVGSWSTSTLAEDRTAAHAHLQSVRLLGAASVSARRGAVALGATLPAVAVWEARWEGDWTAVMVVPEEAEALLAFPQVVIALSAALGDGAELRRAL
jgi:hypothetical protein